MSERVRRAVAEPPAITWAPVELAGLNFLIWMGAALFLIVKVGTTPMLAFAPLVVCHAVLAGWGAREPHLASLLMAAAAHLRPTRSITAQKGHHYVP